MIDDHRVLALVPARGGSKGLARKNVRSLGWRPLVAWPIGAALASSFVDRVVLTTDDAEIARCGRDAGADVPFMRPAALATDAASSADVVLHALDEIARTDDAYDYVVMLEPTSPFTEGKDIDAALRMLHAERHVGDAAVGVARSEIFHPAYSVERQTQGTLKPCFAPDFSHLSRRQDLSEVFFLEGSLYLSDVAVFRREKSFYHGRTLPYIVPRWKALEIDELIDFLFAEAILTRIDELRAESDPSETCKTPEGDARDAAILER